MDCEGAFNLQAGAVKAVYLAPTRALVQVSCALRWRLNISRLRLSNLVSFHEESTTGRTYLRRSGRLTGRSGSEARWA